MNPVLALREGGVVETQVQVNQCYQEDRLI